MCSPTLMLDPVPVNFRKAILILDEATPTQKDIVESLTYENPSLSV